jgi:hypothetical protein
LYRRCIVADVVNVLGFIAGVLVGVAALVVGIMQPGLVALPPSRAAIRSNIS